MLFIPCYAGCHSHFCGAGSFAYNENKFYYYYYYYYYHKTCENMIPMRKMNKTVV